MQEIVHAYIAQVPCRYEWSLIFSLQVPCRPWHFGILSMQQVCSKMHMQNALQPGGGTDIHHMISPFNL